MSEVTDELQLPQDVPEQIGRFKIVEKIGQGAMGVVYRGRDPSIDRDVAIKKLKVEAEPGTEEYEEFTYRFYNEARAAGQLPHPNLVTIYELGEHDGEPFIAMEFIDGVPLKQLVEERRQFTGEQIRNILENVASALDFAHDKGIVHRDLKPANIMLVDDDTVKILDFGIARFSDSTHTEMGSFLGSPSYTSPEQAEGLRVDRRADVFSLAVIAFELMTGHKPFPGKHFTAVLIKIVKQPPVFPDNIEEYGLRRAEFEGIFAQALAKDPDARFSTAGQFVDMLSGLLHNYSPPNAGEDSDDQEQDGNLEMIDELGNSRDKDAEISDIALHESIEEDIDAFFASAFVDDDMDDEDMEVQERVDKTFEAAAEFFESDSDSESAQQTELMPARKRKQQADKEKEVRRQQTADREAVTEPVEEESRQQEPQPQPTGNPSPAHDAPPAQAAASGHAEQEESQERPQEPELQEPTTVAPLPDHLRGRPEEREVKETKPMPEPVAAEEPDEDVGTRISWTVLFVICVILFAATAAGVVYFTGVWRSIPFLNY